MNGNWSIIDAVSCCTFFASPTILYNFDDDPVTFLNVN